MDGVNAHQRDISDPVADACVANLGPELLVPCRIGRAEADMAETGYSCIPRCEVALAAAFRPNHQFDPIAGGILEADKRLHLAQDALGWRTGMHRMAQLIERCCGGIQLALVLHFKPDGLISRITFKIAKRVGPIVRPEIKGFPRLLTDLQAQAFGCKTLGFFEVGSAQPYI